METNKMSGQPVIQVDRAYQVDFEMGITRPRLKLENPAKNLKNKKCRI